MTDVQYQTVLRLQGQGLHAEAAQLLAEAAAGGHVAAMSPLGYRLLAGRGAPLDPGTGVRWIMKAAAKGGGMACSLTAGLLAAGVSGRRQGGAPVFFNVDGLGQPDRDTPHAGLLPTAGEKWLLSQWIRDRVRPGAGDPSLLAALRG